jgi:hypothetical protein
VVRRPAGRVAAVGRRFGRPLESRERGPIAQLVERLAGSQEVRGSNPRGSTEPSRARPPVTMPGNGAPSAGWSTIGGGAVVSGRAVHRTVDGLVPRMLGRDRYRVRGLYPGRGSRSVLFATPSTSNQLTRKTSFRPRRRPTHLRALEEVCLDLVDVAVHMVDVVDVHPRIIGSRGASLQWTGRLPALREPAYLQRSRASLVPRIVLLLSREHNPPPTEWFRRRNEHRHCAPLSTSNSQPGEEGSKPCSISHRAATRLRSDHHARITSRSTWAP